MPYDPNDHRVVLPYPIEGRTTTGQCRCQTWHVQYEFGGHQNALDKAIEHVRECTKTEPVDTQNVDGTRYVWPGYSL